MATSLAGLWRLVRDLAGRMDRIADRDADPAALTGRAGHRRHNLPVMLDVPSRRDHAVDTHAVDPDGQRTPEEALQALDELRADQHRRMRGRWRAERARG